MFTKAFWKATGERVAATMAQAALALVTADGVFNILEVDLRQAATVVGSAGVLALVKALAASRVGGRGPSLTDAEKLPRDG